MLETLPYNGHTTSLDAFWMGVPVISLVGPTVVGRAGLSQLTNLGLPNWWLTALTSLSDARRESGERFGAIGPFAANARERLRRSPLMDAPRFARNIEAAYQFMWQRWCAAGVVR